MGPAEGVGHPRGGTPVRRLRHRAARRGDEDEAIAALLHDALEDKPGQVTEEMLRRKYGDRVLEMVLAAILGDLVARLPPPATLQT
jgi:(p)ppGpp synthase/HD superfamily hydrolase